VPSFDQIDPAILAALVGYRAEKIAA